LFESNARILT